MRSLLLARVGLLLTTWFALAAGPPAAAVGVGPPGVWPLDPRPSVVARFDPPEDRWGAGHRGVDLSGHLGQRVRSALPGRVGFAGTIAGRGVVVVDHGGTRTTYEPVAATVAVGDRVAAGDAIGRLTLFGSHCFPRSCLHWGLIEGHEHYLDPLTLVGAAPVRLLPLAGLPGVLAPDPFRGPAGAWFVASGEGLPSGRADPMVPSSGPGPSPRPPPRASPARGAGALPGIHD